MGGEPIQSSPHAHVWSIISYADDVTVWSSGHSASAANAELEQLAAKLAAFLPTNALALNKAKTQFLVVGTAPDTFSVSVDGEQITNVGSIDHLGIAIAADLSLGAHAKSVAARADAVAAVAHRLMAHLSRGPYLRQLVQRVMQGQINYAAAAVAIEGWKDE